VNIYIAHYHFEEISSALGDWSSVNTACS